MESTKPVDSKLLPANAYRKLEPGEVYEPDPSRPDDVPEYRHPFNRPDVYRAVLPASNGIATARSLAAFYAALTAEPPALVRRENLDQVTTPTNRRGDVDEVIGFPIRWGTGWHMGFYGKGSTLRTFGHGGAGGQVGFGDPDRDLAFAFLCNGQRKPEFLVWRMELQNLAYAACSD